MNGSSDVIPQRSNTRRSASLMYRSFACRGSRNVALKQFQATILAPGPVPDSESVTLHSCRAQLDLGTTAHRPAAPRNFSRSRPLQPLTERSCAAPRGTVPVAANAPCPAAIAWTPLERFSAGAGQPLKAWRGPGTAAFTHASTPRAPRPRRPPDRLWRVHSRPRPRARKHGPRSPHPAARAPRRGRPRS
jgi:hypothetical protein